MKAHTSYLNVCSRKYVLWIKRKYSPFTVTFMVMCKSYMLSTWLPLFSCFTQMLPNLLFFCSKSCICFQILPYSPHRLHLNGFKYNLMPSESLGSSYSVAHIGCHIYLLSLLDKILIVKLNFTDLFYLYYFDYELANCS